MPGPGRRRPSPPPATVADAGESARCSSGPALTLIDAVAVLPSSVAVRVCAPAVFTVQRPPVHEPSGLRDSVVDPVTSPREFPAASNAWTEYVWDPPAVSVVAAGLRTM